MAHREATLVPGWPVTAWRMAKEIGVEVEFEVLASGVFEKFCTRSQEPLDYSLDPRVELDLDAAVNATLVDGENPPSQESPTLQEAFHVGVALGRVVMGTDASPRIWSAHVDEDADWVSALVVDTYPNAFVDHGGTPFQEAVLHWLDVLCQEDGSVVEEQVAARIYAGIAYALIDHYIAHELVPGLAELADMTVLVPPSGDTRRIYAPLSADG